ncbi:cytochrome c3 family protein [Eggerthellaceae bacterium zg-1084]|uniref:Cytochrome c3 family protein n=1 Tax=Berryella wangjianweii TaxID=2734634 RepID=A0A6M8J2Z6_9ACTN|nr:cytochrome c3 family protein [Berryella wangjianweii]NPD31517.1 cytochrome c3 family protein [Berryella wangjianweii]NPD32988.1 cytochrome c3 family protein [Eggerthellaceae bacterium zg-997]QKF07864.1 cytochrome c3 family protein [Berryella wangjianweii]
MIGSEEEGRVSDGASPQSAEGPGASPALKPKRGRKPAILGAVAAAMVVLGVAFFVWHEQPSFCNAICHTPMDPYVESYYSTDDTMLASMHMQAGKTCLDCHEPTVESQVKEAAHWLTGNYAVDAETGKLASRGGQLATQQTCLRAGCHNISLEKLKNKTAYLPLNPHDFSQHGVTDCGSCHKMHGQSVIVCSECHYQAAESVPEGWSSIPYREKR